MSNRFYSLLSLVIAGALGAILFITSENVQHSEKDLADVREKLAVERDSMRVLNAEWTYLNRPDRLEQLSQTYLNLTPAAPAQVLDTAAAIPEPIVPVRPGLKPAIVPANFQDTTQTDGRVIAASTAAARPAPAAPKKLPPPATNPSFNQLIGRLATNGNQAP